MVSSKYVKIVSVIIGLVVVSGIGICVFNNRNDKNISTMAVQDEQISNDNFVNETEINDKSVKDEVLNPVQKYYKDNLETEENKFLSNAKSHQNNDLAFSKLQMKFIKATDVLNEKYIDTIDVNDPYYKNNWVKIPYVEGSYFYSVNSEYLLHKYGQYISSAYKEWLKFIIKRETVMQDGGLTIAPDKLREYIIFLERFVDKNSEFVLIEDAKDILKSYLMIYLEGIDNSPIFDKWNTKRMLPEFKSSYENFLSENKDSKYYPMVEELYNKSKENDFAWDRDFDKWLYEYHKKYFED